MALFTEDDGDVLAARRRVDRLGHADGRPGRRRPGTPNTAPSGSARFTAVATAGAQAVRGLDHVAAGAGGRSGRDGAADGGDAHGGAFHVQPSSRHSATRRLTMPWAHPGPVVGDDGQERASGRSNTTFVLSLSAMAYSPPFADAAIASFIASSLASTSTRRRDDAAGRRPSKSTGRRPATVRRTSSTIPAHVHLHRQVEPSPEGWWPRWRPRGTATGRRGG